MAKPAKRTSKTKKTTVKKAVKKAAKKTATKKAVKSAPVKKSTKVEKSAKVSKVKKATLEKKRVSKTFKSRKPEQAPVKKAVKPAVSAPKPKINKKPSVLSEQKILEKLKEIFPALNRKRVLENVQLDKKQVKKLVTKYPNFLARVPVDIKTSLGIEDDSTREAAEKAKQAKVRKVDETKAKDAEGLLSAFEAAKAARGEVQTSKVIKAMQLRVNRRLVGIYGNLRKVRTQINNYTAIVLADMANDYRKTDATLAGLLDGESVNVARVFRVEEANDYDYFDSKGSKLDADDTHPLDVEGDFVDEDLEGGVGLVPSMALKPAPAEDNVTTAAEDNSVPDYDDSSSLFDDADDSVGDAPASGKKKITRKKVNSIKILGQTRTRYADRAYMTTKTSETKNMFGGLKRSAFVGFTMGMIDTQGTFSSSAVDYDEQGNAKRKEELNQVNSGLTTLSLHDNKNLFDSFAAKLGAKIGMRHNAGIGLVHIMSRQAINFLKLNGFATNYRILIRNNADNTGRYGILVAVRKNEMGAGSVVLTALFGCLGLAHNELVTLCQGDFTEANDQLLEYVTHSIIANGLMSQGRVFGFSSKERALIAPARQGSGITGGVGDKIIKMANGHIHFLPDIDRRQEFVSYKESLKLPETLDNTLTDADGKTEYDKYAGSVVYVDMASNTAFWYSKAGKLNTTLFNGACELNARDKADIMKPSPTLLGNSNAYDPTNPHDRENMSPYGAETKLPIKYCGPRVLNDLTNGGKLPAGFPGISGNFIEVRLEDLRQSYQHDRIYWNAIDMVIDNFLHAGSDKFDRDDQSGTGNAYTLVDSGNGGLTDVDWDTASDSLYAKGRLTGRDVSAIKIMLHIATKTYEEWPDVAVWQKKAEDARVKPPKQEDLDDVVGQYNGLVTDKDGNAPTLMPHQAYVLHTMHHQETAALDCDMGGGKTLMSILDATRWIKDGVHGKPARPCIVMPASLIQNYMSDVKKNFLGANVNFFVLSSSTRSWSKMDNTKIVDIARATPANTVFIASYEWLGLDAYPIITGTRLKNFTVEINGGKRKFTREIPNIEKVFPNPQALIDIGINVIYLDESQKIKNKSSGFHKAVQVLSGIPVKRIMTGTMVSRDVDDVFTQTSFIDGTMIGTRHRFQTMYCEEGSQTEIKKGLEKQVRLHLMASGVMQLRRSMWLGLLPKKEEHFEFVDLEDLHGAVYEVLVEDLIQDGKDLEEQASSYYGKNSAQLMDARNYLSALLYGADSDFDDNDTTKDLEKLRTEAVGDEDEGDDNEDSTAGRSTSKENKVGKILEKKHSMATKVAMLQAFISSPQALKPKVFSEQAQERIKNLNVELPEHTAKDIRIVELIDKHWSALSGKKYVKMSKQDDLYAVPEQKRGKIIIFALNIATVEHVHAYLKKTKYADCVARYLKSDSGANDVLEDFKDPENEKVSIIVAAETSVIYGQNMQAADMMIKLTIPWTTGDYDQAVARIYRNGQKLKCSVYNVCANGTFEITKLAKFLIRQNSNRKLISDYTNKYNMNHALGSISKGSAAANLKSGADLLNFTYEDKTTGYDVHLNLLEVHQSVYDHEILEAEKHMKVFREAGYGDLNTSRIEMFSGNPVIGPEEASLLPVDPDGKACEPGQFNRADMAYFDGENIVRSRELNKKSLTAEIKRNRNLELAQELGADVVDALNQKGANVLLTQYMSRATDEILAKYPAYKKFIPGDSTRGFLLFMGQALRDGDTRLLFAKNLSVNNFAEKAGNDLTDLETRAELISFARLVYNKVISFYPGCTAIDDTLELRYDKKNVPVSIVGYDEKVDKALIRKNAGIISSVLGKDTGKQEQTHTEKMLETKKQEQARKTIAPVTEDVDEDNEDREQEPEIEEGINLGVSEMIYYDADEGVVNKTSNDSIYLFAPVNGNDAKMLRKLAHVNLGVGRGQKAFGKKSMWVYNRPVTSMSDVVKVAARIEQVNGFVEKAGRGPAAKYAITTDPASIMLFRVKAPSNFDKLETLQGGLHGHVAEASVKVTSAAKKFEVNLGLFMYDRRILLVGECKDTSVLQRAGFKQIQLLRVDFDHNAKLQTQLETCFKRIRKAGMAILNSDLVARRLRILIGKKVEV